MSVVFTKALVEKTGELDDVMASFLEEQLTSIQDSLVSELPKAKADTVWKTVSTFSTLEGTKIPLNREEIRTRLDFKDEEVDYILQALEKSRILRLVDGVYEIAHDSLALQIADKRSADEIAFLEIEKLVKDRYNSYEKTKELLTSRELGIVLPYRSKLNIDKVHHDYIDRSERKVLKRRLLYGILLASVFVLISGFGIVAGIQRREALIAKERALESEKIALEQEEYALIARKNAEESAKAAANSARIANEEKAAAEIAKAEADRQKDIAQQALVVAEQERIAADSARNSAERSAKIAQDKKEEAEKAKVEADTAKNRAIRSKELARKAEVKAKNLRKKDFAQSLAIKSTQIKSRPVTKAKLAMLSYNIYRSSDSIYVNKDADMYNAVMQAVDVLYPEDHCVINEHKGAVRAIESPNNDENVFYSLSSDGNVIQWNVEEWKNNEKPKVNQRNIVKSAPIIEKSMAISNDNKVLIHGGQYASLEIYQLDNQSYKPIQNVRLENDKGLFDVVFHPNNKDFYVVDGNNSIRKYNLDKSTVTEVTSLQFDHKVDKIGISPSGNTLILGDDKGQVMLGKTSLSALNFLTIYERKSRVTAIEFIDEENVLIGYSNGNIDMLRIKGDQVDSVKTSNLHFQQVTDFDVKDEYFASSSKDGSIKLWKIEEFGQNISNPLSLEDNMPWAMSVMFAPNGQIIGGYLDGQIKFWNVNVKELAEELCGLLDDTKLTDKEKSQYIGQQKLVERKKMEYIDNNDEATIEYINYCKKE